MKSNLKVLPLAMLTLIGVSLLHVDQTMANDDTATGKVKEVGHDIGRGTKKAVRKVKDETCEMVNGKMECAAKKVKHSIQNGADNVEDAAD